MGEVLQVVHLIGCTLAGKAAGSAAGPVVDDEVDFLARQAAGHNEEATGDVSRIATQPLVSLHAAGLVSVET